MKLRRRRLGLVSLLTAVTAPLFVAASPDAPPIDHAVVLPGPAVPPPVDSPPVAPAEHTFSLRHIYHHGTYHRPQLHRRRDIDESEIGPRVWLAAEDEHDKEQLGSLKARSSPVNIERLVDRRPSVVDPMVFAAREQGYVNILSPSAWTVDETSGPDITDKETVMNLAFMAADAYVENDDESDWLDVGVPFNKTADFGWQTDGLRGHIFADKDNSTVVIGLKGTSMAVFDGDGTTTNDKVNDNLFFSCCCAQQGQWTWHQVCDCATGTYACNNTCVTQALREENRYYAAARELYSNVTYIYPDANIWLAGHSLGGAVSSLLGLTYGLPVVTYEAVPEAMAAGRLGLPVPPGADQLLHQERTNTGAFHFGHTADPVYIGTCHGATASCSFAGYAMESACHTGQECVYDVVTDKGWRVGIGTHRIRSVINDVIKKYDEVPKCVSTPECRDCANWKMYESNGTETTTTSTATTTSVTRTRTETCKTPGWWGCLDESTTATGTSTPSSSSTSTSSTSTCETPGWFGCNDPTTTISSATEDPTASTTCATPGRFWGCYDETSSTAAATESPVTEAPTVTPTETSAPSKAPSEPHCRRRYWFGWCRDWAVDGEEQEEEGEEEEQDLEDWGPEEI